jgi:hypothetical protein
MSASTQTSNGDVMLRWSIIIAIALIAFFASYRYAVAASGASQAVGANGLASTGGGQVTSVSGGGGCCGGGAKTAATGVTGGAPTGAAGSGAAVGTPSGGGGCCGGGASGPATTKAAAVTGGVQTIAVDLSKGYYDPSVIQLKAGVPAEITFGQASGCTGIVQSQQLGFSEDLSTGPKTVKLAGLQPGTYQFACGMGMVTGSIVVK